MFLNPPVKRYLRSSAMRQTLVLLLVFALITTVAWLGTYLMVIRDTNQLVQQRLDALVASAVNSLQHGNPLPAQPGHFLAIEQAGVVISGQLPAEFSPTGKAPGYHHLESTTDLKRTDYVILIHNTDTHRIIVAENVEQLEEATDILLAGLQFSLVAALLAAFVAGVAIARRNQSRLSNISHVLTSVAHGNLHSRVKDTGSGDDLSLLAGHINDTIARLEATMAQMRVQTANIAHDLRTPLARFRAVLEERYLALTDHNEPVTADALTDALKQVDRIVDTFNALLRIARIESGDQKSSFIAVALDDLIDRVEDTFGPVIEDRGQRLNVIKHHPATITGDPDMIIQLLGNLIQNALRYGTPRQQITLSAEGTTLVVCDQGPGIPLAERERVLQPLYQQEQQRQGEGFGLGLSLVNAICQLHEAQLTLAPGPQNKGLQVAVNFPVMRASENG